MPTILQTPKNIAKDTTKKKSQLVEIVGCD